MEDSKTGANEFKLILKNKNCLLVLFIIFMLCSKAFGQREECIEIAPDQNFTVRSVSIMGRWVPEKLKTRVNELIGVGGPFSDSRVSAAQALISEELKASENHFPPQLSGAVAVSFITVTYCAVADAPAEVAVIIYPRYTRIDLFNIGNNFLPVPRSPKPTFYEKVPPVLLAFSPIIGFNNDRRFGPSIAVQTVTDLLHVTDLSKGSKKIKLNVGIEARKSFTTDFYNFGGGLELTQPAVSGKGLGWGLGMNFLNKAQPLGKGKYNYKNFKVEGALQGSVKLPFIKTYFAGGSLYNLTDVFDTLPSKSAQNSEKGFGLFLFTDGFVKKNFGRLGLWFNYGLPKESKTSYQRLSAKIAYGTSLKTKKDSHQTFEVEAIAGSGFAWGGVPVYSQFYAGNTATNFLYDPIGTTRNDAMPEGPIVRSIGEKEGTLFPSSGRIKGGTSYWHLNLNFSIPIQRWSRPLIPAILINETTGATLQTKLKSLAKGSAEAGVSLDLIDNKGFPENAQTDSLAERIVAKEILPMIEFVTDRANVFAFKPVLLFDVAGIRQAGIGRTWVGAGAGFQLTIVIARLQAGYMHTVYPSSETSKGNFFLQLVFQNFY